MSTNFDITFGDEPEYLRVTTVGKYSFPDLFPFLQQVKIRAQELRAKNVLIDSRHLEGNMTEAERFQGGQKIAELFGSRIKIALIMPPSTITKLGELTAVNRGARFLVTPCEVEALNWLLK